MVIDTSAVVTILQKESDAPRLITALEQEPIRRISAATVVELGVVLLARFGEHGEREGDLFIQRLKIDVIAVTEEHAEIAREAYRRFGKGRHRAGLNFGDCFSYALAIALNEPLLFVGDDFSHTDLQIA